MTNKLNYLILTSNINLHISFKSGLWGGMNYITAGQVVLVVHGFIALSGVSPPLFI